MQVALDEFSSRYISLKEIQNVGHQQSESQVNIRYFQTKLFFTIQVIFAATDLELKSAT